MGTVRREPGPDASRGFKWGDDGEVAPYFIADRLAARSSSRPVANSAPMTASSGTVEPPPVGASVPSGTGVKMRCPLPPPPTKSCR